MSPPNEEVQFQTLSRVSELPVVQSAWQIATERYEQLKGFSPLVAQGLSTAEKTVQYVSETSKPVVKRLERPLSIADSYLCQGLDKLEEQAPVIKKSPDDVKAEVWNKLDELKGFGSAKVEGLKSYGYGRVNEAMGSVYVAAVIKSLDTAIDATESLVDRYLPPAENESEKHLPDSADVVARMAHVTDKMKTRMYSQATVQASHIQEQTRKLMTTVQQLVATLSTVEPSVNGMKDLSDKARKEVAHAVEVIQGLLASLATTIQSRTATVTASPSATPAAVASGTTTKSRKAASKAAVSAETSNSNSSQSQ